MEKTDSGQNIREIAELCGMSLATAYRIAGGRFSTNNPRHARARKLFAAAGILNDRRKEEKQLLVGFAGHVPSPELEQFFQIFRAEKTMEAFAAHGVVPRYIPYPALKNPEMAHKMLDGVDALMVSSSYLDPATLTVLRTYPGRLMFTDTQFVCDALPGSQALPELYPALKELDDRFKFGSYRRAVILSGGHRNSQGLEKAVRSYFYNAELNIPLETVIFEDNTQTTESYFRRHPDDWEGALLFSLSEKFSYPARSVLGKRLPDLINFGNNEVYRTPEKEAFFTSIDLQVEQTVQEEIALFLKLAANRSLPDCIVKIPASAVIRQSVCGKK
jgi:hypothetical protein